MVIYALLRSRCGVKVAIVGGGLAGIAAARYAIAKGCEIDLFEVSENFGGRLAHTVIDSCVIDKGFQVVNMNYPELRKLLSGKKVPSLPIFTSLNFLDENGVRRDLSPLNIASALSSASGSLLQKIRFLIYLFAKSKATLTLETQSSRFKDLYTRVLSPFLSGVFLTNPDKIRGDVAHHILRYFLLGRPRLINGGIGNLIPILMEGIPKSQLHPNSKVMQIIQSPHDQLLSLRVERNQQEEIFENFDYVIIATNGNIGEIEGTAGGNSRQWLTSTTVYHKVNRLPKKNRKLFLGTSFVNSLVASDANSTYADAKSSLIATTFLGELTDSMWQEKKDEYETEIAFLYNCNPKELHLLSIERVAKALPLFSPEDPARDQLSTLDPAIDRIVYAGDAFDEPSQNGALRSGRLAVEKILQSSALHR